MPDLIHSLQSHDLGHLRIVASLWGLELAAVEPQAALQELAAALLDPGLAAEILESLPADARSALEALSKEGGRMPWAAFTRRFGEIREVGRGRRDRQQVYLNPVSAAEVLFYRALLGRAFFDTPNGPQEFAYISEDMLSIIHRGARKERRENEKSKVSAGSVLSVVKEAPLGRPASPAERAEVIPADDRILDDACTLLAALRLGWTSVPRPENLLLPEADLRELLRAAKIIADSKPLPEPVKRFLALPRREALAMLVEAWLHSGTFNELRQLPGLVCEGEWANQPLVTRQFLLDLLSAVPPGQWWSLTAFVRAIKEHYPDFQRPAGDYDSWFIKRLSDGVYLRGFAAWDEVDGALVRYLIGGPLSWLGLVELATPTEGGVVTAFRRTNNASQRTQPETEKLHVSSQGKISVPRLAARAARYQIARFCEWEDDKGGDYRYRVTTGSLTSANQQGLKVSQLLSLLARNAASEVPPVFVKALKRWEVYGSEARLETQTVLRVSRPEVLEELRKSKVGRFLGELLGPAAVVVKPGAQPKVLAALAEMGLLAESSTDSATDKLTGTE